MLNLARKVFKAATAKATARTPAKKAPLSPEGRCLRCESAGVTRDAVARVGGVPLCQAHLDQPSTSAAPWPRGFRAGLALGPQRPAWRETWDTEGYE